MDCCHCRGVEAFFDEKTARKELKRYRKRGPAKTTRILIEALKAEGIRGMTLLDIGGGIGALQQELLRVGVSSATNVEASTAYLEVSKAEAERRGYADRVSYHHANFIDIASDIAEADIVTLDRVICCYPDAQALVSLSAARAKHLYGVVYPQYRWLNKVFVSSANLYLQVRGCAMRSFLHRPETVEAIVRRHSLKQRFHRKSFPWQIVVYGR
jgi:tRNA A58 N-methylase Trm61